MKLASLGLFVFELATFLPDEITRDQAWSHPTSDRIGAGPASQFTGPAGDTLSLPGMIVPEAGGSYGTIATLVKMADEGDAYDFIDGTGQIWGSYTIVKLSQRRRAMLPDGTPRIVDFVIDLERKYD